MYRAQSRCKEIGCEKGVFRKSGSENLTGVLMRGEWVTVERTECKAEQVDILKKVTVWPEDAGQSAEEGHRGRKEQGSGGVLP